MVCQVQICVVNPKSIHYKPFNILNKMSWWSLKLCCSVNWDWILYRCKIERNSKNLNFRTGSNLQYIHSSASWIIKTSVQISSISIQVNNASLRKTFKLHMDVVNIDIILDEAIVIFITRETSADTEKTRRARRGAGKHQPGSCSPVCNYLLFINNAEELSAN